MESLVDLLGKGSASIAGVEIGEKSAGMTGSKIELLGMDSELREVVRKVVLIISLGIKIEKSLGRSMKWSSRNWLSIGAKGSGICVEWRMESVIGNGGASRIQI